MDGLEAVELKLSEIDLNDRYDAEYFWKESLTIENTLKKRGANKFRTFGDFVASAFYPAATQLYEFGDVPFIRCVDCISYPLITQIQEEKFEKIPRNFIENNTGINQVNKGDIIITKVGSPCYASLLEDYGNVALSRTVLGVQNIRNINNYYLLVFLRSKYGFEQLLRQRELTIQYQLTLERVKNIQIFVPSVQFQTAIEELTKEQLQINQQSISIYQQAENLLLTELDLQNWQLTQGNTEVKSFANSFLQSGRLDAEYYQPKFDEVIKKIKQTENYKLSELVKIKKSIEPGSAAYMDEGIPFIRVADLSKFGLSETEIHLSPTKELENLFLKKDTILLSKDGSVGIAYKMEEDMQAVTSGAILHLTVTHKNVLPDYLTLVLNSRLTQLQAERDAGGSIIQHWRMNEIENVLIPVIHLEKQQQIAQLIQQSFLLKKQSQQLLQTAKLAVEKAIEESEEAAMEFISLTLNNNKQQ